HWLLHMHRRATCQEDSPPNTHPTYRAKTSTGPLCDGQASFPPTGGEEGYELHCAMCHICRLPRTCFYTIDYLQHGGCIPQAGSHRGVRQDSYATSSGHGAQRSDSTRYKSLLTAPARCRGKNVKPIVYETTPK